MSQLPFHRGINHLPNGACLVRNPVGVIFPRTLRLSQETIQGRRDNSKIRCHQMETWVNVQIGDSACIQRHRCGRVVTEAGTAVGLDEVA